jgi:micrococcal nuclease
MYEYRVVFRNAVDGDTVDVVIDLGLNVHKAERLRLAGLDAPELRAKDPAQRKAAEEAQAYVRQMLSAASAITVRTDKPYSTDKYGRWLGTVSFTINGETRCLNDELIAQGHAKPYDGGVRS